jgi:uncharacterized spore protein YtfJ
MQLDAVMHDLAERIEKAASVKAAFGEPYQDGGLTVIPVASVTARIGGGGGFGAGPKAGAAEQQQGGGGGLGVKVESRPVGFIKVASGEASFEPILDATALWGKVALFGGIALVLAFWAMTRRR